MLVHVSQEFMESWVSKDNSRFPFLHFNIFSYQLILNFYAAKGNFELELFENFSNLANTVS